MSYIGHEKVQNELNKIVKTSSIGHAYLFIGKEGIGKKLVALDFAKDIMCDNPKDGTACNECMACMRFNTSPDVKVLAPDEDKGKRQIKVDQIREFNKELFLLPTASSRKVFIIDDADLMNEQSQNALLKVLEEPPLYATLILVASNKEKLLGTIRSRVTEVAFDILTEEELRKILTELKVKEIDDAIAYANGSAKRALEYAKDKTFEVSKELVDLISKKDFLELNAKLEELKASKSMKVKLEHILKNTMQLFSNEFKRTGKYDYEIMIALEKAIQNIRRNANVDMTLNVLMLDVCKV